VLILVIAAIWQPLQANYHQVRKGYTWQVHNYGLDMLQQPLPAEAAGGSTVIGLVGEMTLLRYFQQTENRRPDLETVAADAETARFAAIEQALTAGKAVFLTRELPGAAARWSLSAVGPLIQIQPDRVTSLPSGLTPTAQPVTPEISLTGYDVSFPPHTGQGPPPVRLTVAWQLGQARLAADLKVSARLLTAAGEAVAVTDTGPVHFAYPTSAWRPGEVVVDVYDLELGPETPPGQYFPLLIWYDPAQNAAEVGRVELAPMTIY
jgi:hypothetical protein